GVLALPLYSWHPAFSARITAADVVRLPFGPAKAMAITQMWDAPDPLGTDDAAQRLTFIEQLRNIVEQEAHPWNPWVRWAVLSRLSDASVQRGAESEVAGLLRDMLGSATSFWEWITGYTILQTLTVSPDEQRLTKEALTPLENGPWYAKLIYYIADDE